jgi:hypothetical protein
MRCEFRVRCSPREKKRLSRGTDQQLLRRHTGDVCLVYVYAQQNISIEFDYVELHAAISKWKVTE